MALRGWSARRYAEAILALATEQGNVAEWRDGLAEAAAGLSGDALRLLAAPSINLEARRRALRSATEKAPPGVRALLLTLLRRERIGALPDVARAFGELLDARDGIDRAVITTATALEGAARGELVRELERTTGRTLRAAFAVDPQLIGGAVVRVGDRQIDGSLRTRLALLRERLAAAP